MATTLCPCGSVATIFCKAGALCDACFASLCPCCGLVVPEGVEHFLPTRIEAEQAAYEAALVREHDLFA